MRNPISSSFLTALCVLTGCAGATASAPLHQTLPGARLVLVCQTPEHELPVVMSAVPVQLGAWEGAEPLPDGGSAVVVARVPQSVPTLHAVIEPEIDPTLVGTERHPRFNYRGVPLLPYGTFWIGLANTTDQPIVVYPDELRIVLGAEDARPIVDGGALFGRWSQTLFEMHDVFDGSPRTGWQLLQLHDSLPVLEKPVTLPSHGTWRGFVVFDTGAYTADEYAALLVRAGHVSLRLERGGEDPVGLEFAVDQRPLDAVCLPGTKAPSFRRCEVLAEKSAVGTVRPAHGIRSRAMTRVPLALVLGLAACSNGYECRSGDDGCSCKSNDDCDGMGLVCESGLCIAHPAVKRVFATSHGYPGNLGGVKGADGLCGVVARSTKLTGSWVAWLSTSMEGAAEHVKNFAPWYLMDLTTVAFATSDELRTSPNVVITRDEANEDLSTNALGVWTGTTAGELTGEACADWTDDDSSGTVGSLLSPATWTSTGAAASCATLNRLYCFEQ